MGKAMGRRRRFVHLHAHSPFSFLDGATDIEGLVNGAAEMGQPALACTDHDNVSATVRFQKAAKKAGIAPIQGAEVTLDDGSHLVLLADGPEGYAALCRCLTAAHLGSARQEPRLSLEVLAKEAPGRLIGLSGCRRGRIPQAILRGDWSGALKSAEDLSRCFAPRDFLLELEGTLLPGSRGLNAALAELGERLSLPLVATNNVHFRAKEDFPVHDLLTCVRTLTRVDDVHPERRLNAENYLKSAEEMAEVFADYPGALDHAVEVAERCRPALVLEKSLFPSFQSPDGQDSAGYLRRLVYDGAVRRYAKLTESVRRRLDHELDIITRLGFEDYFLLVWDVAAFARRQGIRYAGRGSAADSAVAYCLFITDVDSIRRGLLFERFLSMERAEKPDIDIDFDSRRRDEATRYVYEKYGASRVATVATYSTFHARSAIRDFGKAMGLPEEDVDALAKRVPYYYADDLAKAFEAVPEIRDAGLPLHKFQAISKACAAVSGFPRFLGTHLGGVVICREELTNVTPLQMSAKGVVVTQFDKDDIEDLGLVKLDLLCLRTLGAVDDAIRSIEKGQERSGGKGAARSQRFDYDRIPQGDRDTYRMINRGETIGVFQLESPAQRALQSRLHADNFEDIVASVAIIRPGPIKGNMVEPFIARRQGKEPVTYLHPKLEPILGKTFGVVLFQEQVIEIANSIAGFSPGDADRLRRVMSHGRSFKDMQAIGEEFVERAVALGVEKAVADQIFASMVGYASYGFCEAHAAAFANTAYKTAYLVRHYPAEFFAAILSNQPMGYYPPQTLAVEARRRGVGFLPLDINRSGESFGVEEKAIRLSLKQLKGMTAASLEAILQARDEPGAGPFRSLEEFCPRVGRFGGLERDVVENLIRAGAFDSLEGNRKALLWRLDTAVAAARAVLAADGQGFFLAPLPDTDGGVERVERAAPADFSLKEKFVMEYDLLGINSGGHFMQFFREGLAGRGYRSTKEVRSARPGTRVKIAGFPVRPHRPPTKSGKTIVFLSLEDEFGLADVTVFEHIYQRFGKFIFSDPAPPLVIWGKVERRGLGAAVIAEKIAEFTGSMAAR